MGIWEGRMGGATVEQWGQLAPTEIRLWGQNYVIAPTEIRRARSERYKKEILPPLAKSRDAAPGRASSIPLLSTPMAIGGYEEIRGE